MEKKHIIFALKIFLASVLLGIFAGFLGLNPLGISQGQVVVLSLVLGQVQLVALLVAVVIHLYTNVAQLRKTKRYFK